MERRSFLRLFGLAAAAFAVEKPSIEQIVEVAQTDPEFEHLAMDELSQAVAKAYLPGITDHMFKNSPLLEYLKSKQVAS